MSSGRQARRSLALPHLPQPRHLGQGTGTGRGHQPPLQGLGTPWGHPREGQRPSLNPMVLPIALAAACGQSELVPACRRAAGEAQAPSPPRQPPRAAAARPDPGTSQGRQPGEQLQNQPAAAFPMAPGQRGRAGAMASPGFGTHRPRGSVCAAPSGFIKSLGKGSLISAGWERCRGSLGAGRRGQAPAPCHCRLGGPFLGGD